MADLKSILHAIFNWERVITQLFARLDGPMHFRFIMQPLMAAILATIDGIKDGKAGKPAYLWRSFRPLRIERRCCGKAGSV